LGVFNDVTNIVNYYQGRGYNIDNDKIGNGSKVSLFTSALSYQFVYQFVRMFSGKSVRFHPWEFRGVQLPNTLFYMNRSGLSYKIRSGYRFGEWRFPFAVEYGYEGEKRTEFTFGAEKGFEKITAVFEAIIGKRLDLALDVSLPPEQMAHVIWRIRSLRPTEFAWRTINSQLGTWLSLP